MIVQYYEKAGSRKFNCLQAVRDGWGFQLWEDFLNALPLKLRARERDEEATIIHCEDFMGIMTVDFEGGGFQALDHCVEEFALSAETTLTDEGLK